jgi:hypothetical protein
MAGCSNSTLARVRTEKSCSWTSSGPGSTPVESPALGGRPSEPRRRACGDPQWGLVPIVISYACVMVLVAMPDRTKLALVG